MVGLKTSNKRLKNERDVLHQNMVLDSMRQRERDEPRKSHRAGLCDGTKVTTTERLGNLHELLVMSYTIDYNLIIPTLQKHRIRMQKWRTVSSFSYHLTNGFMTTALSIMYKMHNPLCQNQN